eukprot:scaffold221841_cov28-Tisochrysis_lutea.AAC.6
MGASAFIICSPLFTCMMSEIFGSTTTITNYEHFLAGTKIDGAHQDHFRDESCGSWLNVHRHHDSSTASCVSCIPRVPHTTATAT